VSKKFSKPWFITGLKRADDRLGAVFEHDLFWIFQKSILLIFG